MEEMEKRVSDIRHRMQKAADKAHRELSEITLMGVTKTRTLDEIQLLHSCGVTLFGENRVQEVEEKFHNPPFRCEVHMIGQLQSNKVHKVVPLVSCIQSIDSLKLINRVDRIAQKHHKIMEVMIEYNTSGEESKAGFLHTQDCLRATEEILDSSHLSLRGFMTIGPLGGNESDVRRSFQSLYQLREKVCHEFSYRKHLDLSMGMSGDFEIAIEEGATLVRVGSSLFGPRRYV